MLHYREDLVKRLICRTVAYTYLIPCRINYMPNDPTYTNFESNHLRKPLGPAHVPLTMDA